MSVVRSVIFLTVFVIQHVQTLPTNLQRRDVDRVLKENAEDLDSPDKRALHQSAEQELEASLNKRSNIKYNLNKLHDPAKQSQNEQGKETIDRESRVLQKESENHPSEHHKREGKQLDETSKARKNTFPDLSNVEESHDYYQPIRDKEEKRQGSPDQELKELPELGEEQVGKQPNVDEEDDSFNHYEQELQDLRAVKEGRHEGHPPIKKKSSEEKHDKRYDEILRKLHPPEEDEEEEREIQTSAEREIKEREGSLEQKLAKENVVGGKDDLREFDSLEGRKHSEEQIHAKKEQHDVSQLHHERTRKEVVDEKGREKNSNVKKTNVEGHSLSSRNLQFDDIDDSRDLDEGLGQHLVARSLNEDNQNNREALKDNRSQMEKRLRADYYTTHEDHDSENTRDATKNNQEQYLSSHKNEDITRKDEHNIGEENRAEENGSGNLTPLHEGNDHKDHSLNHEGLQDSHSFADENELILPKEDEVNELLKKEEEHEDDAEGNYVIPNLQEEQDDESTVKRDNFTPSQVEGNEPSTLYHDGANESEDEYQKKKRLIERLESLSLMARNGDVPREYFEHFVGEDTNDGTNVKRISPPIQSKKSLKGLKDVSMVRRNDIKTFAEPMKSINDDEVSERHAFLDEENSDRNQLDEMQNGLRRKRTKSICRTCCSVERCWMIQGLHCNC